MNISDICTNNLQNNRLPNLKTVGKVTQTNGVPYLLCYFLKSSTAGSFVINYHKLKSESNAHF